MGDAFNWAWNKFSKNAVALIVPTLAYGAILIFISVFLQILTPDRQTSSYGGDGSYGFSTNAALGGGSIVVLLLGYVVFVVVGAFIQASFISGCLDIADGKPVTIGAFFKPRNFGKVIVIALLLGLVTAVGTFLCGIFGVISAFLALVGLLLSAVLTFAIGFFAMFAVAFAVDRSLPAVEALKASIATVRPNFGNALLSWLVQLAVVVIGAVLCLVGLLAAAPIALLILVYTYRVLSGGRVAPLSP